MWQTAGIVSFTLNVINIQYKHVNTHTQTTSLSHATFTCHILSEKIPNCHIFYIQYVYYFRKKYTTLQYYTKVTTYVGRQGEVRTGETVQKATSMSYRDMI